MEVFPVTPVALCLLALFAVMGTGKLFGFVILTLPFGMLAVAVLTGLGGLSLLLTQVAAAALAGLLALQAALDLVRRRPVLVPREALLLGLFTAYAIISATLLVRIFAGSFEVFPLSRGTGGVAISIFFLSTLAPVSPGSSNISQSAYILLGFGFFISAVTMVRQHGVALAERWLRIAAGINIAFGVLDFLGLDPLLAAVRTATYALANEQVIGGLSRTVGGFPEPSSFGSFSALMFAYFAGVFITSRRPADGLLALGNLGLALMSLAATAMFALAVVFVAIGIVVVVHIRGTFWRPLVLTAALVTCVTVAVFTVALMATGVGDFVGHIINATILEKADSQSGLERGAWALYGLKTFVASYGLGAGAGSLRSNGLFPTMLGSVGLPGMLAFVAFLWFALARPLGRAATSDVRGAFLGARLAAAAQLATMLLSLTVPDPGIPLLLFTAIAAGARMIGRRERQATAPAMSVRAALPAPAE